MAIAEIHKSLENRGLIRSPRAHDEVQAFFIIDAEGFQVALRTVLIDRIGGPLTPNWARCEARVLREDGDTSMIDTLRGLAYLVGFEKDCAPGEVDDYGDKPETYKGNPHCTSVDFPVSIDMAKEIIKRSRRSMTWGASVGSGVYFSECVTKTKFYPAYYLIQEAEK